MSSNPQKSFVDTFVDACWASLDWVGGVGKKVESSRAESAKRRAEKLAEPPKRVSVKAEPAGAPVAGTKPRKPLFPRISLPKLRLRRDSKPKTFPCPSCGFENSPPVVFCSQCHSSFIHISKLAILTLVTLAIACFFSAEYFGPQLDWPFPWPIYVFFATSFLMINSILLRKARAVSFVAFWWGMAFMAGGLLVFYFGLKETGTLVGTAVEQLSGILRDYEIALIVFVSFLGLAALILLVWMARHYTLAHSYRILILFFAAAAFGARFLVPRLSQYPEVARALWFLPETEATTELLELISLNLLRVLAAEIVVYSLVLSYKPAMQAFERRRVKPRPAKAKASTSPLDQGIEGFYLLSVTLMNTFTRFYLQIEQSFISIFRLIRELMMNLADFVWLLLRDLILPIASLSAAAWAIYMLSNATETYISRGTLPALGQALGFSALLYVMQMIFLACKTRISVMRLIGSEVLLTVWFAPYMLTLFVFISISLYAVGLVMIRWNERLSYPFRIGPMTISALGFMAVLLVFAVLRRHRSGTDLPEDQTAED